MCMDGSGISHFILKSYPKLQSQHLFLYIKSKTANFCFERVIVLKGKYCWEMRP